MRAGSRIAERPFWLRTMSRRHSECRRVADDALVFAAKAHKVELTPETQCTPDGGVLQTPVLARCSSGIRLLKKAGIPLVFLFNLTARILDAGIQNPQLDGMY